MPYDELSLLLDIQKDIEHFLRHRRNRPVIVVDGVSVHLIPHMRIVMDISKKVGDTVAFGIKFVAADGTEVTGIKPDSAPAWSDSNSAVETITESADGLTAGGPVIAAGTDTVKVDLMVGGVPFSALSVVTATVVTPPPPAFDHIEIVAT